jgi:fucose 4-O-acetylase-like acetyltransferase
MTVISARRLDIDRAKGLGIVLVVFGHLAAKSRPLGNDWFGYAQTAVYQFHMPFFMYLSGYVGMLAGSVIVNQSRWHSLVMSRAQRLLVPFLGFGLALTLGKLVAAGFLHVDNAPESLTSALRGLLWNTDKSPAISVWYIGVLFVFSVITPILFWASGARLSLLLLFSLAIYWIPVPPIAFADRMVAFYVFFILGATCASRDRQWIRFVDRAFVVIFPIFLFIVALCVLFFDDLPQSVRLLAAGLMSMPALHGLVRRAPVARSGHLLALGMFSFVIYLLNTPFIGIAKGLMLKVLPWDGYNFLIFVPLLMAAGLYGPMLMKKFVFRYFATLDKLTS